jgi:hypothetical protein
MRSSDILSSHIEPLLSGGEPSTVVFLRSRHQTEADKQLSGLVARHQKSGIPCVIDDPNETRLQPLAWYAQKIYSAISVLAHFCSEEREGCRIHNARYAFVCGLALGFEKPILMLAEDEYRPPLDYQHLWRITQLRVLVLVKGSLFFQRRNRITRIQKEVAKADSLPSNLRPN